MADSEEQTIARGVNPTVLRDLPDGAKRGWKAYLNGEEITEPIRSIVISNPGFGDLRYGATPMGYDAWAFHENGGGGSVVIPYAVLDGRLYIGLILQNRPNQGGKVLNVPRGFLEPGKNHFETAHKESDEEVGYGKPYDITPLGGEPQNPNSTFFETWGQGEGVRFYALPIPSEALESNGARFRFKPGHVKSDPSSKAAKTVEQILGAEFLPLEEVANLSDMFTTSGALRLALHLKSFQQTLIPLSSPPKKFHASSIAAANVDERTVS
jgi:hypothetical protein